MALGLTAAPIVGNTLMYLWKDNAMTVEQYIASVAKTLGGTITFKNAVRFEKGEGIEKKQENFAAEIASMVNGNK